MTPTAMARMPRAAQCMSGLGRMQPSGGWASLDGNSAAGRWQGPVRSDALLGLHAPGGSRVGQGRMVAFGLVGVGLGEVGHGLVELA